jgi:hypothetical protein
VKYLRELVGDRPVHRDSIGTTNVEIMGEAPDPNRLRTSHQGVVTPDLFTAMGTKLIAGRRFKDAIASKRIG